MVHRSLSAEEILVSLTHCVRFLSVAQVARGWFDRDPARALWALERLAERRLVATRARFAHPELEATTPVLSWSPGHPAPDFRPAAYELRRRWTEGCEELPLVFPTAEACKRYGGTRVTPRSSELSHDLHMGSVFLATRERLGEALIWRSGDWLRSAGLNEFGSGVPDAALLDSEGSVVHLVEGGGRYCVAKLSEIHTAYRHYPYTIW